MTSYGPSSKKLYMALSQKSAAIQTFATSERLLRQRQEWENPKESDQQSHQLILTGGCRGSSYKRRLVLR